MEKTGESQDAGIGGVNMVSLKVQKEVGVREELQECWDDRVWMHKNSLKILSSVCFQASLAVAFLRRGMLTTQKQPRK